MSRLPFERRGDTAPVSEKRRAHDESRTRPPPDADPAHEPGGARERCRSVGGRDRRARRRASGRRRSRRLSRGGRAPDDGAGRDAHVDVAKAPRRPFPRCPGGHRRDARRARRAGANTRSRESPHRTRLGPRGVGPAAAHQDPGSPPGGCGPGGQPRGSGSGPSLLLGPEPERAAALRQRRHHVLDDRVVLDRVHRQVLAVAGLLEPAVRHLARERDVVVDPHGPEPQRVGDAQGAPDVARPHRRREAVRRAVAPGDRLVLVGELLDGDDRPEDLALDHLVVLLEVGDDGRLEEEAGQVGLVAARHDLRVRRRALEEALDALALAGRVQRPEVRVGRAHVAHHVALGLVGEAVDDVVVDLAGGEHARRGGAVLAGVVVADAGDRLEDRVEVDVVEDDDRRLAAELEVDALEGLGGVLGDPLARLDRAGERDDVDAGVLDDRRAGVVAAGDDVQHALRQDLGRELGQLQRRHRGRRRRLEDDRAAGRERRADLPHRHHQRVVPRRDLARDAGRLAADHRRVALEVLAARLALEVARRAGEEAQVVDHRGQLVVLERLQRLAGVGRLELRDLVAVLLDRVGEREQRGRALGRRAAAPRLERLLRGLHRAVDVLRRGVRRLGDLLARARVDDGRRAALRGVDELAVDEVLERVRCGRHRVRLLGGRFGRNVAPGRAPDRPIRGTPERRTGNTDSDGRDCVWSAALGLPNEGGRTPMEDQVRRILAALIAVAALLALAAPAFGAGGDASLARGRAEIARSRVLLDEALRAVKTGDRKRAYALSREAYLDHFEFVEIPLRLRNPNLVLDTEFKYAKLRNDIRDGASLGTIRSDTAIVRSALIDVDRELARKGVAAPLVAFGFSFSILFREGVEAVLLIAILLGSLAAGSAANYKRPLAMGVGAAVAATAVLFALAPLVVHIGPLRRGLLEAVTALIAVVVLIAVSFWLVSRLEHRRRMEFMRARGGSAMAAGTTAAFVGLGFTAVFREGFETVLFYQALALFAQGLILWVVLGAAAAALALGGVGYAILKLGKQLPLKPMLISGAGILLLLSVAFVGNAVRSLQSADLLAATPVSWPRLPVFLAELTGIHPTSQGLLVQAALLGVYVLGAVYVFAWQPSRRRRRVGETATA